MKISLQCDYGIRCASSPRRCRYVNFEQGQNLRSEVAIMKFPILFYCALGVSAALLAFLPRFVSFLPTFQNVAETPSSEMGVLYSIRYVWPFESKDSGNQSPTSRLVAVRFLPDCKHVALSTATSRRSIADQLQTCRRLVGDYNLLS